MAAKPKPKTVKAKTPPKPKFSGTIREAIPMESRPIPKRGVATYFLAYAQNNTYVEPTLWKNMMALKEFYGAELLVSRGTYNRNAYERRNPGKDAALSEELFYDPKITPFVCDHRVELAPGLVFCGEQDISPTAEHPLSGFESFTGPRSAIFPHTKIAMQSIPGFGSEAEKFLYTTGAVTQQNYVQRKVGFKAMFHHTYGFSLAEVDSDGNWWVRQLNCSRNGELYDLNVRVKNGRVRVGHWAEAINWGDIHEDERCPDAFRAGFAPGGLLDMLRPKKQFMHDTLNFARRGHHDIKNALAMFDAWVTGKESVAEELRNCKEFLAVESYRPWCETVVVDSNHDCAMGRWLDEADYRKDPVNSELFLKLELRRRQAKRERDDRFHLFEWCMRDLGLTDKVRFLRDDEGFIICADANGGIQCGMHGHQGANGAKGSPRNFARSGMRSNTGHTHSAGIIWGNYCAGVTGKKRMRYNKGLSSWSQSHIVTYVNGKRTIVTMRAGKLYATRSFRGTNVRKARRTGTK